MSSEGEFPKQLVVAEYEEYFAKLHSGLSAGQIEFSISKPSAELAPEEQAKIILTKNYTTLAVQNDVHFVGMEPIMKVAKGLARTSKSALSEEMKQLLSGYSVEFGFIAQTKQQILEVPASFTAGIIRADKGFRDHPINDYKQNGNLTELVKNIRDWCHYLTMLAFREFAFSPAKEDVLAALPQISFQSIKPHFKNIPPFMEGLQDIGNVHIILRVILARLAVNPQDNDLIYLRDFGLELKVLHSMFSRMIQENSYPDNHPQVLQKNVDEPYDVICHEDQYTYDWVSDAQVIFQLVNSDVESELPECIHPDKFHDFFAYNKLVDVLPCISYQGIKILDILMTEGIKKMRGDCNYGKYLEFLRRCLDLVSDDFLSEMRDCGEFLNFNTCIDDLSNFLIRSKKFLTKEKPDLHPGVLKAMIRTAVMGGKYDFISDIAPSYDILCVGYRENDKDKTIAEYLDENMDYNAQLFDFLDYYAGKFIPKSKTTDFPHGEPVYIREIFEFCQKKFATNPELFIKLALDYPELTLAVAAERSIRDTAQGRYDPKAADIAKDKWNFPRKGYTEEEHIENEKLFKKAQEAFVKAVKHNRHPKVESKTQEQSTQVDFENINKPMNATSPMVGSVAAEVQLEQRMLEAVEMNRVEQFARELGSCKGFMDRKAFPNLMREKLHTEPHDGPLHKAFWHFIVPILAGMGDDDVRDVLDLYQSCSPVSSHEHSQTDWDNDVPHVG